MMVFNTKHIKSKIFNLKLGEWNGTVLTIHHIKILNTYSQTNRKKMYHGIANKMKVLKPC